MRNPTRLAEDNIGIWNEGNDVLTQETSAVTERNGTPMHKILSAIALASVLTTAHPTFADRIATPASDHAQAATSATEPPALPGPSSDATAPVGFGWG